MKPQPRSFPITETIIGFSRGAQIRGVTELYFPSKFEEIHCVVDNLKYELENMQQLRLIVDFSLTGNEENFLKMYDEEEWKMKTTEHLFENLSEETRAFNLPVPVFGLMLSKYLSVSSVKLTVDGKNQPVVFDQTPDVLILPNSYPPLCELPSDATYSYYEKKATAFYADLSLNKKYHIEVDLESWGTFENAPFFPFPNVVLKKVECFSNGDVDIFGFYNKVEPVKADSFPDWISYKFEKLTSFENMPPLRIPALSYRGEETLFNPIEHFRKRFQETGEMPQIPKDYFLSTDKIKDIVLENYEAPRFGFSLIIPPQKDFEVVVRAIRRPIPARIYEQMHYLPNYQDVLVEYDIFNFSGKKARLRVETEIDGFTEKESKTIFIHKTNNNNGQRARKRIAQSPRLKRGVLESIVNPERATMVCRVHDEDKKEVLYEETFNIEFLPHDQMIWSIRDVKNSHYYDLRAFICAWIQPNDKNGLFDKVRTGAIKYSTQGFLGLQNNSLAEIKEHVRVVYEYLKNDIGIRYVSQPFTALQENDSQRVVLPEKVIENKAGNCIDLTVVFASILEGFGIYSLIFLTENHAFIGWGNLRKTSEMFFLETTCIGSSSFDDAVKIGEKKFKENFLFIGSEDAIPGLFPSIRNGRQVVDLNEARKQGIIARI